MIPSDHFVRFYNEVFKFLDAQDGLTAYYEEIGRLQDFHCHDLFRQKGLQGVYEYYQKIRREENCDLDIILKDHELTLMMNVCPSLSKVLNNDAGACPKYCLHCPGWTLGVYQRAGLYQIYDLMGFDNPQCCEWIFDDLAYAQAKYEALQQSRPDRRLLKNF